MSKERDNAQPHEEIFSANSFAHTLQGRSTDEWEPLLVHLQTTAHMAENFASSFCCDALAKFLGFIHDVGKNSNEFQKYLLKCNGLLPGAAISVDHKSAGAQWISQYAKPPLKQLLPFIIAGHHGGLPNSGSVDICEEGTLRQKLSSKIPAWESENPALQKELSALADQAHLSLCSLPDSVKSQFFKNGYSASFWMRMLYSSLVDADFLATEQFISKDQADYRSHSDIPPLAKLAALLETRLTQFTEQSEETPVNQVRAEVSQACLDAASQTPGIFSLTVPTGGGKTLASLRFALQHALQHGMKRIIYVIPYTSIIEQTAEVFRQLFAELGDHVVLEHHSNIREAEQDSKTLLWAKLVSENWDAPLIITTSAQFFDSLHAAKPSKCRKLHNIAKSIIILDEAQMLPIKVLHPCLNALSELPYYNSSLILCTATQPALSKRKDFTFGLKDVREIIPHPRQHFERLKRTNVEWAYGDKEALLKEEDIAEILSQHPQALCIVDTRRLAANLFHALLVQCKESIFHLSAAMCPDHRSAVLDEVKARLVQGLPCRLISTQLIEAGVDIDFPVVMRSVAGMDSLAQAAGRCNREGKLASGKMILFRSEKPSPLDDIRKAADSASEILSELQPGSDIFTPDLIEQYFNLHYWRRSKEMDQLEVLSCLPDNPSEHTGYKFRELAKRFKLIDDDSCPVIVPWSPSAKQDCEQLRQAYDATTRRTILRRLQRSIVSLNPRDYQQLKAIGGIQTVHEYYDILTNTLPEFYNPNIGIQLTVNTAENTANSYFI